MTSLSSYTADMNETIQLWSGERQKYKNGDPIPDQIKKAIIEDLLDKIIEGKLYTINRVEDDGRYLYQIGLEIVDPNAEVFEEGEPDSDSDV